MTNKIRDKIKKAIIVGSLAIAGVSSYSGQKFEEIPNTPNDPLLTEYITNISRNYFYNVDKTTPFERAEKMYEANQKSELERILNEDKKQNEELEKRKFLESYYLSQDSLNQYIKEAYNNVKKWPKEFDKRLFRIMIRQESGYNVHAVSKTGYLGLGQVGPEVYETFRPEEFASLKDSITGELDKHSLKKELLGKPVKNLELSLQYLDYISKFCAKYDPNWEKSDLETKRKKILFAYNAGVGTAKDYGFDPNNPNKEKLPKENREYANKIMSAYYNSNIKVKI